VLREAAKRVAFAFISRAAVSRSSALFGFRFCGGRTGASWRCILVSGLLEAKFYADVNAQSRLMTANTWDRRKQTRPLRPAVLPLPSDVLAD
jgi:hypothetical protein